MLLYILSYSKLPAFFGEKMLQRWWLPKKEAPMRILSVATTRLSMRSMNCDLTSNTCNRQRTIPETRKQVPETISAGRLLSTLRNKEERDCSIHVRALVLAKLPPSIATA